MEVGIYRKCVNHLFKRLTEDNEAREEGWCDKALVKGGEGEGREGKTHRQTNPHKPCLFFSFTGTFVRGGT